MKQLFSFAIAFVLSLTLTAQTDSEQEATPSEKESKSLDSGNIQSQFEYVIEESNRYQEYKVVKMTWLETLKAHVADSMKAVRKQLTETQNTVATQKTDITALNTTLQTTRDSLATVNTEKNSITFINAQMTKGAYKSMMWMLTGGLLALLLFFVYKFKNSNVVTVETQKTLAETMQEFEAFKKRAREREQVLKRELQDELNKRLV